MPKLKLKGCGTPSKAQLLEAGFDLDRPIHHTTQQWSGEAMPIQVFTQEDR